MIALRRSWKTSSAGTAVCRCDAMPPMPPPKICRRIRQLFLLLSSPNPNEASNARDKLERLLLKWGLKWGDLTACVAIAYEEDERRAAKPRRHVLAMRQQR